MLKTRLQLLTAFTILLLGISVPAGFHFYKKMKPASDTTSMLQNVKQRTEAPDNDWKSSFFEALEERTRRVNLPRLQAPLSREDDLELRFWYDARPDIINGVIISRSRTGWSAVGIRQVNNRWPSPVRQESLGTPKSGWDTVWKQLTSAGILTLPDGQETKCVARVLDGSGFVVEVIANQKYRTYMYGNPQFADCDEAKRMLVIESILASEFSFWSDR